jgi:hypothetical protein
MQSVNPCRVTPLHDSVTRNAVLLRATPSHAVRRAHRIGAIGVNSPPDFEAAAREKIDPVLEVLALADDTQVVLSRLQDGQIRAASKSWDEAKVILADQAPELLIVTAGYTCRARSTSGSPATCKVRPHRWAKGARSPLLQGLMWRRHRAKCDAVTLQ